MLWSRLTILTSSVENGKPDWYDKMIDMIKKLRHFNWMNVQYEAMER